MLVKHDFGVQQLDVNVGDLVSIEDEFYIVSSSSNAYSDPGSRYLVSISHGIVRKYSSIGSLHNDILKYNRAIRIYPKSEYGLKLFRLSDENQS